MRIRSGEGQVREVREQVVTMPLGLMLQPSGISWT